MNMDVPAWNQARPCSRCGQSGVGEGDCPTCEEPGSWRRVSLTETGLPSTPGRTLPSESQRPPQPSAYPGRQPPPPYSGPPGYPPPPAPAYPAPSAPGYAQPPASGYPGYPSYPGYSWPAGTPYPAPGYGPYPPPYPPAAPPPVYGTPPAPAYSPYLAPAWPTVGERLSTKVSRLLLVSTTGSLLILLLVGNLLALLVSGPMVFGELAHSGFYIGLPYPNTPLAEPEALIPIEGAYFQAYYLFIWVSIVVSVGWLLYRYLPSWLQTVKGWNHTPGTNPQAPLADQGPLAVMAGCFTLSALTSILVITGARVAGANPEVLDLSGQPAWQTLFLLANASVWEEVMFRLLLIGLPLALYQLVSRRLTAPWYRHLLGGVKEWSLAALILVVFSSAYFAYAHVGHGWDWFKVPGTFLAGLMFAYFFVRWGLPAAIVFHFLFDYSMAWSTLYEAGVGGALVILPLLIAGLAILAVLGLGFFALFWLVPTYWRAVKEVLASVWADRSSSRSASSEYDSDMW